MGVIAQAGANVAVNKLVTQLVLDNKQYSIGMKDAEGKMVNLGRVGKTLGIGIAAIGTGMAATFSAAALLTKQTVAQGDKFEKLSQRIGVSVEKLSAYEHVANLSGTTVESMGNSVARLSRNMLDTSQGIGEAKDAFKRLGIEVTDSDGKLKSADDVMLAIAARFEEMPDGAEKTALSMQLMGRAGKEMVPMLNQGAKGMKDMLAEGTKLRGWTTAQAKESAFLNDNFARITTAMKGAKDMVGKALIPIFQAGIQTLQEFSVGGKDVLDGVLKKFPDVIREWVIPAFSAFLETSNTLITAVKIGWNGLQYAINSVVEFIFRDINSLIQGISRLGSKIPGIGKTIEKAALISQAAYDTISEAVEKNGKAIDKNLKDHQKNKDKIAGLQDSLIIKYTESNIRMNDSNKKFNDAVLATTFETYDEIDEKREEHQQTIIDTETALKDSINKLTLDKHDYAQTKLDEEYELKKDNVEDKALLDEWYKLESGKIKDEEAKDNEKRTKERIRKEKEAYEKEHKFRIGLQAEITDAIVQGGNVEQAITKYTSSVVIDTLQKGAKEKIAILMEAAVKIITGHVAEGLSMVGASSLSVWDAIPNVVAYGASIAAQIEGAKAISNNINFAVGVWLNNHPQGGVINQGSSSGMADDVLLGSQGNTDVFGSRGESVFVMNAGATKRYLPTLSAMNMSTGFAGGGLVGKAMSKMSPHATFSPGMSKDEQVGAAASNISIGLLKHALVGWATAGDWLHGIPFGAKDAGLNVGTVIPSMFAGKVIGNKAGKKALGFGFGGLIKIFKDPKGWIEDKWEGVKKFANDPLGTITDEISRMLRKMFSFDDIQEWLTRMIKYVPGMSEVGASLVGPDMKMPKVNLKKSLKNLTIKGFLSDAGATADMLLPFHNGGVLGSSGMSPLGPNEVPFAGVGQKGEMLLPPGKVGNTINLNFVLNGIDRANARTVVNDYIIPELNFYLTSKGGARI